MNVALRRAMTLDEFLAWEDQQELRWEFDGFGPVAMVGGTLAHSTISLNIGSELRSRLRGTPCRAFVEGLKVVVAGSIRYPDAFVACGPQPRDATIAENPVVVFEVESPSTAHIDYGLKNAEYRATPSIQRYVILAQDRIAATIFERRGAEWVGSLLTDPAAPLAMPEIGVTLILSDLYEGVLEP